LFQSGRNFAGAVGWTLCATAFFLEFGSMSLVGWATFMVVGAVPALMFVLLAGGPPITIAEVLFNAENDKGGRVHETRR
jgi:hypothetical protein